MEPGFGTVTGITREYGEKVSDYKFCLPFSSTIQSVPADTLLGMRENLPEDFTLLLRTHEMIMCELYRESIDKNPVTYWIKTSCLFNGSGALIGVIESLRDVIAEKIAQSDLMRMNRYHRTLIRSSY